MICNHQHDEGTGANVAGDQSQQHEDSVNTYQKHDGIGDNIAGDKYQLIQSVTADHLTGVAERILELIRDFRLGYAREILNTLSAQRNLSKDAVFLISALKLKIELAEGKRDIKTRDLRTWLRAAALESELRDAIVSILMHAEWHKDQDLARDTYETLGCKDKYSNEVFFELMASEQELGSLLQKPRSYSLSEIELYGIIKGALKNGSPELAFRAATLLHEEVGNNESKALLLNTKVGLAYKKQEANQSIIFFDIEEKRLLDELSKQIIELFPKTHQKPVLGLIQLIDIYADTNPELCRLANQNIELIRGLAPDLADFLADVNAETIIKDPQSLLSNTSLSLEEFGEFYRLLKLNRISTSDLDSWRESGGKVVSGDEYLDEFCKCLLLTELANPLTQQAKESIERVVELIGTEEYSKKIKQLNPVYLNELCQNLLRLEMPLEVIKLLSNSFGNSPWVSPLYEDYLKALCLAEKYKSFKEATSHLESSDKTECVLILQSQVYALFKGDNQAIKILDELLENNAKNTFAWSLLFKYLRQTDAREDTLESYLAKIPEDVFESYSTSGMTLLVEIAMSIDADFSESVIIDWFLKDPYGMAEPLSSFHFGSLINQAKQRGRTYASKISSGAVTFNDGFKTRTKILVKNIEVKNESLIDEDSELGKCLRDQQEGEQAKGFGSVSNVTIIKREAVNGAAIRLATKIRDSKNDGRDSFRLFEIPDNEDILNTIERAVSSFGGNKQISNEELYKKYNAPLFLRGVTEFPNNPVQAALSLLTRENVNEYVSINQKGSQSSERFLLDVYGVVYFCLLGLSRYIANSGVAIVLTETTVNRLKEWQKKTIQSHGYNGDLREETSAPLSPAVVDVDTPEFLDQINSLLEYASVATDEVFDTPDDLFKIKDALDPSVYSTFRFQATSAVPWLCLDPAISALSYKSGYQVEDPRAFISRISEEANFSVRRKAIHTSLNYHIPYVIKYSDILELSLSGTNADQLDVFLFIDKFGDSFISDGISWHFLAALVLRTIAGELRSDNETAIPQPGQGYLKSIVYRCFRLSLKYAEGDTAESRFGLLIYELYKELKDNQLALNLLSYLITEFASGHFLSIDAIKDELGKRLTTNPDMSGAGKAG